MQFKIPQNVQIEDKIVGPLTLKQLGILGLGGGITYMLYISLSKRYFVEVWLPPTAISGLLTLAFTFLRFNGIPFGKWILLMIEYWARPRHRYFVQGAGDHYQSTIFVEEKAKEKGPTAEEEEMTRYDKLKKIGEISKLIDTHEAPKAT